MKVKLYIGSSYIFFFSLFCLPNTRASDFYPTPDIRSAYQKALELKLEPAKFLTTQIRMTQPDNLALEFIEDYIDLLEIYFSDDKVFFKNRSSHETNRLDKIDATGNLFSPFTKYMQAEIRMHWALLHLKFGNHLAAFQRIKKASDLLTANKKLFPDFTPNQKSLGLIQALMSSIPNEYKWIVKTWSGLSGSMDQARFEVEQVLLYCDQHDFLFKDETLVIYSMIAGELDNDYNTALNILQKMDLMPSQSIMPVPLFCTPDKCMNHCICLSWRAFILKNVWRNHPKNTVPAYIKKQNRASTEFINYYLQLITNEID